jgi:hypothetical protein
MHLSVLRAWENLGLPDQLRGIEKICWRTFLWSLPS